MKQLLFIFAVMLCCMISVKTDSELDTSITAADFPYLANVEIKGKYKCSGAILDDYYVLTTNSCVGALSVKNMHVRVGSARLEKGGKLIKVTNITQYSSILGSSSSLGKYLAAKKSMISKYLGMADVEQGGDTSTADMAMLTMATAFNYNNNVKYLRPNSDGLTSGQTATLPVWASSKKKNSKLLSSVVTIEDSTTCSTAYANNGYNITTGMFCLSASSGSKPCLASLGSPVYYNQQLYGLVSHSPGCSSSLPVVVTQIADHTDFLITAMCNMTSLE